MQQVQSPTLYRACCFLLLYHDQPTTAATVAQKNMKMPRPSSASTVDGSGCWPARSWPICCTALSTASAYLGGKITEAGAIAAQAQRGQRAIDHRHCSGLTCSCMWPPKAGTWLMWANQRSTHSLILVPITQQDCLLHYSPMSR